MFQNLCYDDGCHLKKYSCNPDRANQTPTAKRISDLHIVVDKFHFKGHTDKWCLENCNPYAFEQLRLVRFFLYIPMNSSYFIEVRPTCTSG